MTDTLLTKDELLLATHGDFTGDSKNFVFTSVATDSRNVVKNSLFVPLVGENQDGHIYIPKAVENGASVVLLNKDEFESKSDWYVNFAKEKGVCLVSVKNTLHGLQDAAEAYVNKFPSLLKISITGSCGKTTVKELMASVCVAAFGQENVIYTKGNFNSETGLPLSVFNIRKEHKVGVFEMGMNRENEIGEISKVLKSKYGIITNIGTAHIGILGSRENIAKEKRKSFDYIPCDGAAFIPSKDDFASYCTENVKGKVVKFGKDECGALGIENVESLGILGTRFTLDGTSVTLHLGGEYNFVNALGVIACAKEIGISSEKIKQGVEAVNGLSGRLEVKTLELKNKKSLLLISDCYNANLDSMSSSIDFCAGLNGYGKKFFVLGDMKELGAASEASHRIIGQKLNGVKDSVVFFVGPEMKAGFQEFSGQAFYYENNSDESFAQISEKIAELSDKNDVLLLKGSHSMQLEKLVETFVKDGGVVKNGSL